MVRPLKENDIYEVMSIWLEANTAAHDFVPAKYWTDNFEYVKRILPGSTVFVFKERSEILGFIGISEGYIAGIFVRADVRSGGIGRELLNHVKRFHTKLTLHVFEKNAGAIKFYERERFIILSAQTDEGTGEIELKMLWERD